MTHVFTINGAYLVPTASTRILSPQHLAQQAQDHYPRAEGTGSTTLSKNIMLFWNQRKHTKTVPLGPKLNVGITTTAAGAKYKQYSFKMTSPETKEVNIFETHVIHLKMKMTMSPCNLKTQSKILLKKTRLKSLKLRCHRHLKLKNLKSQSPLLMLFLI